LYAAILQHSCSCAWIASLARAHFAAQALPE
jgi:hypothetical protein